jgi:hypothetical protein
LQKRSLHKHLSSPAYCTLLAKGYLLPQS